MEEEITLSQNNTWELIDLPRGKHTIDSKWAYTLKFKVDGTLERLKAKVVAKGYSQNVDSDNNETFSPVAKLNFVRMFISLETNLNWPLHQLDVKNACHHGDL